MNKNELVKKLKKAVEEYQGYFVTQKRVSALIETFGYSFTPEHEMVIELERLMRRFHEKTKHEDYPDVIMKHKEMIYKEFGDRLVETVWEGIIYDSGKIVAYKEIIVMLEGIKEAGAA